MGSSTYMLLRLVSPGTAGPSLDTTIRLGLGRSLHTCTALLASRSLKRKSTATRGNCGGRKARPSRHLLGLAVCAVAVLVAASLGDAAGNLKLLASARACHIQRSDGSTNQLRRGRYIVVTRDESRDRYFSLVGPGVRKATTASFVGTARWTVSLKQGTYRFRCGSSPRLRGLLIVK